MEILKVILKKNEEDRLIKGHPWVFSNEISGFIGKIKAGDVCDVYSFDHKFIGRGFVNTNSKIMVRLLTNVQEEINEGFFYKRINEAYNFRKSIGLDDSMRIIFSEADMIPGLIVDKYGSCLVIQILSLAIDIRKKMFIDLLVKIINPTTIYERSDSSVRKKEGLEEFKGLVYGIDQTSVIINENGVLLNVDLENGQKTGYFLDQKFNRKSLENYVLNRTVLDCFSHTGSFALHALKYKAKKVTAVDISEKACNDIINNAKLNPTFCNENNLEVKCCDVFNFLRLEEIKDTYDLIILDPPAFTKSKENVKKAYRGYKDINICALKAIKKDGILFTFSCSQFMTPALFMQMIEEAASDTNRKVQMLDFKIQSPDHPILFNSTEALYLKCLVLRVL